MTLLMTPAKVSCIGWLLQARRKCHTIHIERVQPVQYAGIKQELNPHILLCLPLLCQTPEHTSKHHSCLLPLYLCPGCQHCTLTWLGVFTQEMLLSGNISSPINAAPCNSDGTLNTIIIPQLYYIVFIFRSLVWVLCRRIFDHSSVKSFSGRGYILAVWCRP